MKTMDTDKLRFSFQWSPRSVEDVALGEYIGDTIRCTDGRGSELTFTITGRDEVELTKCKGVAIDGCVTIPFKIPFLFRHGEDEIRLSFKVVSIGDDAFCECNSLKEINMSNSVSTIRRRAFYSCSSLTRIIIPASVTSIEELAFLGCGALEEISVENENPVYDSRDNCNAIIETATGRLIQGCAATVIPDSVASIGKLAFSRCKALKEIRIPASVESIEYRAFNSCGIEKISFATTMDSVIEQDIDGYTYFSCISIPCRITTIGRSVFYGCTSLEEISIPASVTSIGSSAFYGCTSLKEIIIPQLPSP